MYVWARSLPSASIDVGYQIDSPSAHSLDQHRSQTRQRGGMARNHFDDSDVAMDDVAEEMEVDEPSYPDYPNQHRWHSGHQPRFDFPTKACPPLTGDTKLKSQIRERRHAALSVLTDPELLMIHAVRNNETIPQTRHRFQHHLIGVNNPNNYAIAFSLHDNLHQSFSCDPPSVATSTVGSSSSLHGPRMSYPDAKAGECDRVSEKTKLSPRVIDIIEVGDGWAREEEVHRAGQGTAPRTRTAKGKEKVLQQYYPAAEASGARTQA